MQFVAFVLNTPWTLIGLILAIFSVPYHISLNTRPFAIIFKVRSFWWYSWLPGRKRTRAMANGHIVQIGPRALSTDLAHELVHVEQAIREPFIKPFLYEIESFKHGYRKNKYEREAYDRTGDTYTAPESWITSKAEMKESSIGGKGLFAKEPIREGEKVVRWGGEYVDTKQAMQAKKAGRLVMQWDDNLYSIEDRGDDDTYFINHTCDPNIWMKDAFTLVARRDIQVGEEITADYALWEADENYVSKWECRCGSSVCRKRITGKDWRSTDIQKKYAGHFSPLLNNRIKTV